MKTLTDVVARDLMKPRVITLRDNAPVEEAIETLEDEKVSGAPVVDVAGALVGVLSFSDIARREHMTGDRLESQRGDYYLANPLDESLEEAAWNDEEFYDKSDYSPEILGHSTVSDWMTRSIISVGPEASLAEVCAVMTRESIHRVLVVADGELQGIISSFDVVRYLAMSL